jgi:RRXRR protein
MRHYVSIFSNAGESKFPRFHVISTFPCAKIGYRYRSLAQKQHNCKLIHICSAATARALLKEGKAKVLRREPFTIILLFGSPSGCGRMDISGTFG